MQLALSLAITAIRSIIGGGGNPTSEAITDESAGGLTDESGNALFDSGA